MKEWFEEWFDSPYYHLLYKHRSEEEANQFVKKIVSNFRLDASHTLLDLACGKGRHSIAFASFGIDVTGIDLSPESIAFAKQNETEHLHFFVHDMRNLFRANYYDFIANQFTSFGYFKTEHDNMLAAKSIATGLKQGGIFLIDFVNRIPAHKHIDENRSEEIVRDNVRFQIERSYTDKKLLKNIAIHGGDNQCSFQESVNSFSKLELQAIFEKNGLTLLSAFGNYQLADYDENESPRMILVFKK